MSSRMLAAAILAALPLPLLAQTQQIRPPIALYWLNVETAGGMGMDMPPGMAGMMPPGMQGGKRMKLDLGSSQAPRGEPRAAHAIPPALGLGASLPLVTPRTERAPTREVDEEREYERPKGRMLIYWGCGEAGRAFRSRGISRPRGPAPGRSRTYGTWQNPEDSRPVPANGSLQGDHSVSGNYSPEIRFSVGERYDFMQAVAFEPVRKTPAGAFAVKWSPVPTATGYFATAMGQGDSQNDMVTWSSSEVQEMGQVLMDYIPPAEVERLIRDKVVLPPQTTECTVPAGIFKTDAAMLNFIAYGNELNLVHPPRPADPKLTWEQEWALKLRLKSTAMTMLAEREGGRRPRSASRGRERAPEQAVQPAPQADSPPAQREQPRDPAADAVQEGVKALRGILRF